jgi:heptosyltransferase-2
MLSGRGTIWSEVRDGAEVWIRLPNWLGDVVMLLPFLRLMQSSCQSARFVFAGKAAFEPILKRFGLDGAYRGLPKKGWGYFGGFLTREHRRPDACVLFTNSLRGDLEALLAGAKIRVGAEFRNRFRPLLSHSLRVPSDLTFPEVHQVKMWEWFVRELGVEGRLDFSPVAREPLGEEEMTVGLIAGSENFPAKRWPEERWRELILNCSGRRFVLFGTEPDRAITNRIASGIGGSRVLNLAGRTNMDDYMKELVKCSVVISNDTGGMHLANALGVPVIGLFGPTNPLRTGPVFQGSVKVIQPLGCPSVGGGDLFGLSCQEVMAGAF